MASMNDRVKIRGYSYGLTIETTNFAFEIKIIIGLESTGLVCHVAEIGLNDPND